MTYGTYANIKQTLEALDIRENIAITVVDGVVTIDNLQGALNEAYSEGYDEGYRDGETLVRPTNL